MDDKIRETCKTCEKRCMQEDLDGSRGVEQLSSRLRGIEQLSRRQKLSRWIEKLSRSYRDCNKEKLKNLNRQPSCREVLKSYRDCLKPVFQRREKHRHECNQACYSTKDPINIISSQKHLSRTIFKHMDPKNTHIDTQQV